MHNNNPTIAALARRGHQFSDFKNDPLVRADQASTALNLPLYYFIDARKRAEIGIPHYLISRFVRFRIREVHKWNVARVAREKQHLTVSKGDMHA